MDTSSDHGRLELASRGEAFPTADTSRECALHLQVPHHKTDTEGIPLSGSQTACFVSKHSHKEAGGDHFAARVVSWYCSSLWLWQACRCLPWIRCLSVVASLSRFSPLGKTQSLPDLMEPPAFRSIQQSQVRSPLSREEGWRLPMPTHPLQYAVQCSHRPITHFSAIRTVTPNSLKLRKGLWSLLSHAGQLSQTLI